MRLVAGGRAGSSVAGGAAVVVQLHRARWQAAAARSGPFGQRRDARRDVVHQPVPEAAAGGGVRVVGGQDVADGARRCAAPAQRGRDVAAGAAVAAAHLLLPQRAAAHDLRAAERQRSGSHIRGGLGHAQAARSRVQHAARAHLRTHHLGRSAARQQHASQQQHSFQSVLHGVPSSRTRPLGHVHPSSICNAASNG